MRATGVMSEQKPNENMSTELLVAPFLGAFPYRSLT